MRSNGMWVECLNCGHKFYLEHHTKRMNTSCCMCLSKECRPVEEDDDFETQGELRFLLRMEGTRIE